MGFFLIWLIPRPCLIWWLLACWWEGPAHNMASCLAWGSWSYCWPTGGWGKAPVQVAMGPVGSGSGAHLLVEGLSPGACFTFVIWNNRVVIVRNLAQMFQIPIEILIVLIGVYTAKIIVKAFKENIILLSFSVFSWVLYLKINNSCFGNLNSLF